MSGLSGKVAAHSIKWLKPPQGSEGFSQVEIQGKSIDVRWKKDADGIWIELPDRLLGFDISSSTSDEGGKSFRLSQRNGPALSTGLEFAREGSSPGQSQTAGKKKGTRVRAQMPGKIVRILVQMGDTVEKGQGLIVMEAMKMENEIKAPFSGKISALKVGEGQAVESGADLILLE